MENTLDNNIEINNNLEIEKDQKNFFLCIKRLFFTNQ